MFSHVSVRPSIHQSVCPHLGGGTLARSRLGDTPVRSRQGATPARGTLSGGTPPQVPPNQTWPLEGTPAGGYPCKRVPNLGYPQSNLAGGPHLRYPPIRPSQGVTLPGGVPHFRKQMEYLIRRCRYASSVHAGGLVIFYNFWIFK